MAWWGSTYCDSTSTPTRGCSARIRLAASRPSRVWVGGMRMSTTTASGGSARTRASSCSASPTWAATSMPAASSTRARPSRNSTASSAITTRMAAPR